MLRISSILYLQKVWECPIEEQKNCNTIETIQEEVEESSEIQINDFTNMSLDEEVEQTEQAKQNRDYRYIEQNESKGLVNQEETLKKPQKITIITQLDQDSKTVELNELCTQLESFQWPEAETICSNYNNTRSPSLVDNRSETPTTYYEEQVSPDREYYADYIMLSDEEDEETKKPVLEKTSKFSPKRMLHRAKSTITEDSVKKLGRKTSLFLDKINSTNKTDDSLPVNANPPLQSFRRQSLKLSVKGKALTNRLKKAISFRQSTLV